MRLTRFASALPFVVAAALTTGACAEPEAADESAGIEAALSQQDWDTAVQHLSQLRYLPWTYYEDGCYARALYYSLTLGAVGVPSNHVYVVAKPGNPLGGSWRYHVAPLVSKDDVANKLFVLDPVYDRSRALPLNEWVGKQIDIAPGQPGYPSTHVHPGISYGTPGTVVRPIPDTVAPSAALFREPSWSAMPAFPISSINSACSVMHKYLERESTTSEGEKTQKHRQLSLETRRLVNAVAARGKLSGSTAALDASCTGFVEGLNACPADDGTTRPPSEVCCLASAHFCWTDGDGGVCAAPGTTRNGRVCGAGGNWVTPVVGSPAPSVTCPADSPTTAPGSEFCCRESDHWCWFDTGGGGCAAPGTVRNGQTCGAGGNWR